MNTKRVPLTREEKIWNIIGMIVIAVVIICLLMGSEKPAIHAACYIGGAIALVLFILDFKYGRVPKRAGEEDEDKKDPFDSCNPFSIYSMGAPGSTYNSSFDD